MCAINHPFCIFSTCSSPASSLVPGSPAAGHAAPGPSNGPSSARFCCPSPRLLLTCPMTSVRGSNRLRVSLATVLPALVFWAKEKKAKRRGRKRRRRGRHLKERNCTTGSMKGLPSAQRVVGEVWIIFVLFNMRENRTRKGQECNV